ncbi:unnamed protein product [Didymodactylos carnosus]|uniref:TIR domain-containing protein n=1 Tax=Didymodactylos carnosus TaxID=1234261 RepID=A0A8S2JKQ6_9BILA|nr:unnamed protein product [Didymodactylos carnosus]CAF3803416.1 unnamed protein product [Didymodactylos carnosus]
MKVAIAKGALLPSNCTISSDLTQLNEVDSHLSKLYDDELSPTLVQFEQLLNNLNTNSSNNNNRNQLYQILLNQYELLQKNPETLIYFIHTILINILRQDITKWEHIELTKFMNDFYNLTNRFTPTKIFYNHFVHRTTFNMFIQLLNCSSILDYLQNQMKNNLCQKTLWTILVISKRACAAGAIINTTDLQPLNIVFESFITNINQQFDTDDKVTNLEIDLICGLLWNLVDRTDLIPFFVITGYPQAILNWLNRSYLKKYFHRPFISLVHNIARHDIGAQVLNDNAVFNVLESYKIHVLDKLTINEAQLLKINLLYSMTTALLLEPDQIKKGANTTNNILDFLLKLIIQSSQANELRYQAFHISEFLIVLTKLFVNDDVVDYVFKQSDQKLTVQYFCDLLIRFEHVTDVDIQLTRTALLNILWSISFNETYKNEMKINDNFMSVIKSLANSNDNIVTEHYLPKHLSNNKKALDGILFNLIGPLEPAVLEKPNKKRPLVMISYSHADKKFCYQLVDALKIKCTNVDWWTDFIRQRSDEEISYAADVWEEIAHAIEISTTIVLVITEDYYKSKSCRQEVAYANDALKKPIIPIYANTVKDYRATGWLGIRIAPLKYIHFGKKTFDVAIEEVTNTVLEYIGMKRQQSSLHEVQAPEVIPAIVEQTTTDENHNSSVLCDKPLKDWTADDVNYWFKQNNIHPDLKNLYQFRTGTALILYFDHLKSNQSREYQITYDLYEDTYKKPLNTAYFINFVDALTRLKEKQQYKTSTKSCLIN